MKVEHVLIAAGLIDIVRAGKKVYDEMENEIGPGGALTEGTRIQVR